MIVDRCEWRWKGEESLVVVYSLAEPSGMPKSAISKVGVVDDRERDTGDGRWEGRQEGDGY